MTNERTAMPLASRWFAYGALALCMALTGVYVALAKPLVAALPVFLLAWMRFGIAGVAMGHWLRPAPGEAPLSRNTLGLLFAESLFGNFLFSICMLWGVSMTSAVSAGVIMASIPAVVALMGWTLLKEHITLRVWAAIACAALGIGLLSLSKSEQAAQQISALQADSTFSREWIGNLLVFGSVLCESIYAVVGKKLTGVLSAKRISALINLCGFALMTPLGLYVAWDFHFAGVPAGAWLMLVFYAMAASVWTVWLWMTGLKSVPAARAGVFTVMLPISAAVTGVLALGETLSLLQGLAFAVALCGIVLATLPDRR